MRWSPLPAHRHREGRRRLARRFRSFEDMILRFATRPDLDIFSNNEAERTIRPVKVQQRGSGRCWRTLTGLAEFALVESYLSTAAKWGISKLDALRDLFQRQPMAPARPRTRREGSSYRTRHIMPPRLGE
jgi:Transposase IS66 family